MPTRRALLLSAAACLPLHAHAGADVYSSPGPWVDDGNRAFDLQSLRGSWTIATMAYGACQRVCSTSVRVIEALHRDARARGLTVRFLVIGLDPAEDKPADWAEYRVAHRLSDPSFTFLCGTPAAIHEAAGRLGVHYWRYGDHVLHDFRIVLVTPQGRVLRSMHRFDDDPAALLPPGLS
jgi:cytochrome oxidase Cu insertion factor (SCO1/SenC/PrrC family)